MKKAFELEEEFLMGYRYLNTDYRRIDSAYGFSLFFLELLKAKKYFL